MNDFEPRNLLAQLPARFERALLLVIGLLMALLLVGVTTTATSGIAHATGYNSWPHPKWMAECWTNLFEQYGANMLKVTQSVAADNAWVKYRITLQGGDEKDLVCYPTSAKVVEEERER